MAAGPADYWPLMPSEGLLRGQRADAFDLVERGPKVWGIPAMLAVFFASSGVLIWAVTVLFELAPIAEDQARSLALFLGGLATAGTVVFWVQQVADQPIRILGISAGPLVDVVLGVATGIGSFVAVTIVSVITAPFLPEPRDSQLPDDLSGFTGVLVVVGVVVCTPIGEELLARGFIMGGLRRRMPFAASLWISALIFAAMHVAPARVVALLVSGVLFGLLYEKRRNLLPCVVAHMTHNAIAVTALIAFKDLAP